jgi:hypothetical protein
MMTQKERQAQKRLEARLKAEINAQKSKNTVKAGANLPSQWGRVVTNEQRLIDNGHFMKTNEGARLDYLREQYRKAKKAQNSETKIVLVKKV